MLHVVQNMTNFLGDILFMMCEYFLETLNSTNVFVGVATLPIILDINLP